MAPPILAKVLIKNRCGYNSTYYNIKFRYIAMLLIRNIVLKSFLQQNEKEIIIWYTAEDPFAFKPDS